MKNVIQDFEVLYQLADEFHDSSRFQDAANLFERALHAKGGTTKQRLDAKYGLCDCLRMLGRYTEAIAYLGELYIEALDQSDYEYAYHALYQKIDTIRCIEESQERETPKNLKRRLKMIEDGLQWLKDIGREEWRHALLYNKAYVLWSLGKREDALDTAEEGYAMYKKHDPGYQLSVYARQVIDYAISLEQYQRAKQILDEMEGINERPHQRVRLLCQKACLLRKTGKYIEALEVARRAIEHVNLLQTPREKLHSYMELTKCAIAVDSFSEALDAMKIIQEIIKQNDTIDKPYLIRNAKSLFREVKEILNAKENKSITKKLLEWLDKIEAEKHI
jgi:tetratricopeptide (TPR) repeat protein